MEVRKQTERYTLEENIQVHIVYKQAIKKRNRGKEYEMTSLYVSSPVYLYQWSFSLSLGVNLEMSRGEKGSVNCGRQNLVYVVCIVSMHKKEIVYFSAKEYFYHMRKCV